MKMSRELVDSLQMKHRRHGFIKLEKIKTNVTKIDGEFMKQKFLVMNVSGGIETLRGLSSMESIDMI